MSWRAWAVAIDETGHELAEGEATRLHPWAASKAAISECAAAYSDLGKSERGIRIEVKTEPA